MPYEDKKAAPQRRPHAVTLDERSHLTVTGVDEVVRFDDTEVSMRTSRGMLTVKTGLESISCFEKRDCLIITDNTGLPQAMPKLAQPIVIGLTDFESPTVKNAVNLSSRKRASDVLSRKFIKIPP